VASSLGRPRLLWTLAGVGAIAIAAIVVWRQGPGGEDRLEDVDRRIDAQHPKEREAGGTKTLAGDAASIKVVLDRLHPDDPGRAQTRIRIGPEEWLVPVGRLTGVPSEDASLEERRAAVFALVKARIRAMHAADPRLPAEIDAPPTKDGEVPTADVMRVLDLFLSVGIVDVDFLGVRSPLPKRPR
jgi:hypothetical protein